MSPLTTRWLKFNAMGAMGIVVQFASFGLLFSLVQLNYIAATALAVEAAVLHNFVWHERFTWKERAALKTGGGWRLLRFHPDNGLRSLRGNLSLMHTLVSG